MRIHPLLTAAVLCAAGCGAAPPPSPTPTPALMPAQPSLPASPTPTLLPAPSPSPTTAPAASPTADAFPVLRVPSGDSVEVEVEGEARLVRYIGLDAPDPGEPGFEDSRRANERLVGGKAVRLEADVQDRDSEGVLLRYVYVGGQLVNRELVRQGYARALAEPPNLTFADEFAELESQARYAGVGLWGQQ